MSSKLRGSDITVMIAIDGKLAGGSMLKVTDGTVNHRTDLVEDDYLGETETDLDIQHHGFDLSVSIHEEDDEALVIAQDIIQREIDHGRPPDVTISFVYVYREPNKRSRMMTYHECVMKQDEEGFGGRKERVKAKFSAKCKRRSLMFV
jgi:hypothetical protein